MSTTLAIAIWGAATGTIGTLATIWTLWRDRARIEVTQRLDLQRPGTFFEARYRLRMIITNEGRRATTIYEAGFAAERMIEGRWPHRQQVPEIRHFFPDETPRRVEPGEPVVFVHDMVRDDGLHPDNPWWGFVEIRKGRFRWANAWDQEDLELLESFAPEIREAQQSNRARQLAWLMRKQSNSA